MVAGQIANARIWRMNNLPDDSVGGAVVSGTVVHPNVAIRFQPQKDNQEFLQQGLETVRTFTAIVTPGHLDIRERDELEITFPYNHPYVNNRFRIVSMNWADFNPGDARSYIILNMVRSVRSHRSQ